MALRKWGIKNRGGVLETLEGEGGGGEGGKGGGHQRKGGPGEGGRGGRASC